MKKISTLIIGCALLSSQIVAQDWNNLSLQQLPSSLKQDVPAKEMDLYNLSLHEMTALLAQAGDNPASSVYIHIPIGGGRIKQLKVWRTPVMAQALQALYPEIQTYTGYDEHNQSITAKLDVTPFGFRAMIFGMEGGTYFVDPYSKSRTDIYAGFYQKDIDRSQISQGICGVGNDAHHSLLPDKHTATTIGNMTAPNTAAKPHGSVKKKFRLAVSCTGEYGQLVGGASPTVASVMAVIASTINRTNGFFEREIAVTMELIPENNTIVYIDPASDPYTCNMDNSCLINEVQTNLDAVFGGTSNYDIGHIFNTAGGGLAQLTAICSGGSQARGVSGTFGPTDIGTIIHEMGHQHGADHTFNSDDGACNGNNNPATSYEPGSGTSVMSYNGNCAPDNVAAPLSDYYHVHTLKQINSFLTEGGGSSCGTTSPGYTPITVMSFGNTYNIPRSTAFELIAAEPEYGEPEMPEITHSWEQYDLGNSGAAESAGSTWDSGPIFQSKAPVSVRDRQFPPNVLVAANTYTDVGERLPSVPRDIRFKLTNRSYFEGWGTFNFSDNEVNVKVLDRAPFRITNLTAPATLTVGATQLITWDTGATRTSPINTGFVSIHMSMDAGLTFPYIITANAPNLGSFNFTVPNVNSNKVRFKVKAVGNIYYDISKANMTINGTFTSIDDLNDLQGINIYPNPATDKIFIKSTNDVQKINVILYGITGQILHQSYHDGDTTIDINGIPAGMYFIKVTDDNSGKSKIEKITIK